MSAFVCATQNGACNESASARRLCIFPVARGMVDFEGKTWVPNEHYETAKALAEPLKLKLFTAVLKGEVRVKVEANWFLDDMDEEDYM